MIGSNFHPITLDDPYRATGRAIIFTPHAIEKKKQQQNYTNPINHKTYSFCLHIDIQYEMNIKPNNQ